MKRFALSAALLAASPAIADQTLEITFTPELGGQPFTCSDTYTGLGATGAPMNVQDYRLFISDAALVAEDGALVPIALDQDGVWQVETVALLDFENAAGSCTNGTSATNAILRGTVPDGRYTGLKFNVGVPFDWNHGDPTVAPSPLNLTAMFWNWRGGYKFVKFEVTPAMAEGMKVAAKPMAAKPMAAKPMAAKPMAGGHGAGGMTPGWFLHLGSTQCAAGSMTDAPQSVCKNPNLMEVTLDGFDPATQVVVIDPAPVLKESDLTKNTPETSPGCMSFPNDPDCAAVLPRMGVPFLDLAAGEQLLFTAR